MTWMTWGCCEFHCLKTTWDRKKARHFWMGLFGIPWICFLMWKTLWKTQHGCRSLGPNSWWSDGTQPHCLFPSGGTKISEVCHVERRWRWRRWEFPVTKNGKHTKNDGTSPFLMGESKCLMGKSPFLMGKSPFSMGKSPFSMGKLTISTGPCSSSQTVSHY